MAKTRFEIVKEDLEYDFQIWQGSTRSQGSMSDLSIERGGNLNRKLRAAQKEGYGVRVVVTEKSLTEPDNQSPDLTSRLVHEGDIIYFNANEVSPNGKLEVAVSAARGLLTVQRFYPEGAIERDNGKNVGVFNCQDIGITLFQITA